MSGPDPDRRQHPRFVLSCPVTVTDAAGNVLMRTRTLNVSDGGALLPAGEETIEIGLDVGVDLNVPRSTANTFMYEPVAADARILRRQRANGGQALALAFIQPLDLDLDA